MCAIDLGAARRETRPSQTEFEVKALLYVRLAEAIGREIELDAPFDAREADRGA